MTVAAGSYFDGQSAARHKVEVRIENDATLVLTGATLPQPQHWPLDRLRALADQPGVDGLTVTLFSEEGDESPREPARLTLRDGEMNARIRRLCPDLHRRDVSRGTWGRVIRYATLATAAVLLMLFVILPRMADTLADLIPVEKEIAFGKSITLQIERALGATDLGDLHCEGPEGQAALDKMLTRLTADQTLEYDLDVTVFDHPMLNAFAAPGGQVIIMRGLLDQASGPDTVAAVLAHEIGHVERRDPTRHALRTVGSAGLLSMVLGDFSGGTIAALLGEQLLRASYTREAEADADGFALDMLNAADIDSSGMAEFFEKLEKLEGGLPEVAAYFATHPASAARAQRARDNAARNDNATPALSPAEWQALKNICG
ncbi:M48 family metallopeptidase [Roseovarius sp. CAU 1744]|uniref:M48 family metallopeptidase n=1 Tax=Roseovarius sp. CAU 1744 TaxID=3140368 RepID=UPI00325A9312